MSEATVPQRAIVSDTDALVAISAEVLAEIRAARTDIARARAEGGGQLWCAVIDARLADGFGIFLDGIKKVRDAAELRTAGEIIAATAPALEAVPAPEPRHRHRKPRYRIPRQRDGRPDPRQGTLWPVNGIAALPAAVKLVAAVAAGLVLTGGGVAAVRAVLSHPSAGPAAPASSQVQASAPGWGTLVSPAPGPSSSLIAFTHPKADAARAGVLDPDAPAPSSWAAPASPAAPSPAASAPPSAAPARGQLQVSALRLDFGLATTETLTLTARLGPVSWTASTGSADVTLDSTTGTLAQDQSVVITVSVNPVDALTQATITFTYGDSSLPVRVTWVLPLPSPAASVLPSALPT